MDSNSKQSAEARRRRLFYILGILVLALVWGSRVRDLGKIPIAGDEGVSCINAMSVLEHGVPLNMYLGQPIFENNFILPWEGNSEYEFKDIGYGRNGYKIYHNWLPIYAIAGSLRLFGFHAGDSARVAPLYSAQERSRMTLAARLPSLGFALISIIALYMAGAALHSRTAGFIAAMIATFLPFYISLTQQAHYYAATAALSAVCAWSVAMMMTRSRWRDFLIGGVLFSLLFHVSMLTALVLSIVWAVSMLILRRRTQTWAVPKLAAFIFIMAITCLPWIVATGLLQHNHDIPKAWALLKFPHDLLSKLEFYPLYLLVFFGLILAMMSVFPLRGKALTRFVAEIRAHRDVYFLLYTWFAATYIGILLAPAAGFGVTRLALSLLIPVLLLGSILLCSSAAALSPRYGAMMAMGAAVVLIAVVTRFTGEGAGSSYVQSAASSSVAAARVHDIDAVIEYLRDSRLLPGTRVYATPNEHLILTFYAGFPIQNIAAARRQFLDSYPRDIVYLEKEDLSPTEAIEPARFRAIASTQASQLTQAEAVRLSCETASLTYRRHIAPKVTKVRPSPESLSVLAASVFPEYEKQLQRRQSTMSADVHAKSILFSGAEAGTRFDWWNGYFYAFVNAATRKEHPNYEERLRNSTATVLSCSNWIAYQSPGNIPAVADSLLPLGKTEN